MPCVLACACAYVCVSVCMCVYVCVCTECKSVGKSRYSLLHNEMPMVHGLNKCEIMTYKFVGARCSSVVRSSLIVQ